MLTTSPLLPEQALLRQKVPAGDYWLQELKAGQTLRILDLLEEIVSSRGQGLLLVTHDMGVVARLAHEVAVMDHGRIVERCDVNTLFSAPRHPVSQRLLAAHLALYGMEFAG